MATKDRNDIELLLAKAHVPSLLKIGSHHHIVTVELIYPRVGVASKSTTQTVVFKKGLFDADDLSWTQKICFKEGVEGNFGLHVTVSETLTATQMRKIARFIAGKSLDIGADVVEDAIPTPIIDEIAKQPLLYASKQLLAATKAKTIVEGFLDLNASMFANEPSVITVPLLSTRKLTFNGKQILRENDPDGDFSFSVIPL